MVYELTTFGSATASDGRARSRRVDLMTVHVIDALMFRHLASTDEMRRIFDEKSLLQKYLDVEAALARVEARLGIIPSEAAAEISARANVDAIDVDELVRQIKTTGQIIVPVVRALADACSGSAGEYVHWGATTQDIMDTGVILQLSEAVQIIHRDLTEVHDVLCRLAAEHKHTVMVGRTYGQHALPITFGYKVAIWAAEVNRNIVRIDECGTRLLVGQFSGAVGTLASFGEHGLAVQECLMNELGLGVPEIAWHASRDNMAEFTSVLAVTVSTLAKMAAEIISLQRTEIDELSEPFVPGNVGSSTMPHKRNPMVCEGIVGMSRLVRAAVAPALEGVINEHERDTWYAEWAFIPEVCAVTGAILERSKYVLKNLVVKPETMERNLEATNGLIASEAVMYGLGARVGRQTAHEVVLELAMRSHDEGLEFRKCLLEDSRVRAALSKSEIDALLDPRNYIGLSAQMVERVIVSSAAEPGQAGEDADLSE
jgi:3-carboxy-cis,cis-muconate cycloisomerase